jgi:uncharacterized protein
MSLEIIRKSDQITSAWSGGTTTQLYIHPQDSSYQGRNFLFRISTATVDAEESQFTRLPGVSRQLMILDGSLKIDHSGRYSRILNKFDTDSFEGDWETKGYGRVIDFNLMTTGKLQGTISGSILKRNDSLEFNSGSNQEFIGLYALKGRLAISSENPNPIVEEGDFIIILPEDNLIPTRVIALEASEIAIATIIFSTGT